MAHMVIFICDSTCDQVQKSELAKQLQYRDDRVEALESDRERLQQSLNTTKEQLRQLEGKLDVEKSTHARRQARDLDKERQRQVATSIKLVI